MGFAPDDRTGGRVADSVVNPLREPIERSLIAASHRGDTISELRDGFGWPRQ